MGKLLQMVLGLVLPLATRENASRFGRALRAIVTLVLIVAVFIALWRVNLWLGIHLRLREIGKPWDEFWLSFIFLLVVVLCWGSYGLWKLMTRPEFESNFPDIDFAWEEAVAALRRAGIDIRDLPVFLVLGRPVGGEETLFQAGNLGGNMPLAVPGAPGPEAPVRVYACKEAKQEAIYVVCPGASVLSTYASRLARQAAPGGQPVQMQEPDLSEEEITRSLTPDNPTMRPGQRKDARELEDLLHKIEREGRNYNDPVVQRELRRIERLGQSGRAPGLDTQVSEEQRARLGHLCRLIATAREPYCGVNGVLVAIPFAGTDSTQDAADAGYACHHDLEMARAALGVHCPVFAVVCDMESAPGFAEFVAQFKTKERMRRMGQRCHLFPSLASGIEDRSKIGAGVVRGTHRSLASWISKGFVRRWIYEKCQLEKAETPDLTKQLTDNSRLFYLLCEMQERQDRLGKVLEVGFSGYAPVTRLLFGGCYLAATGDRPEHRAFMAGVFDRLIEGQSFVYWTDAVKQEEARLKWWISVGWGMLLVMGLLGIAGVAWLWRVRGASTPAASGKAALAALGVAHGSGKNGNSLRSSAASGCRPYSHTSNASA